MGVKSAIALSLDYRVSRGYCVGREVLQGGIMFKNETERAFVLVILMCGFALLWMMVKDVALAS